MNQKITKLSDDYLQILRLIEGLNDKNIFKSFENTLRVQDGILNLFDSLYYLVGDNKDITSNKNIILDMFDFQNFLNTYRLTTIIQRAIELGATMQHFTFDDFMLLVGLGDKDINIVLASSKYINDEVARKIFKPIVYKVLDNLFLNDVLSIEFKKELLAFLCEDENKKSSTCQLLINKYKHLK